MIVVYDDARTYYLRGPMRTLRMAVVATTFVGAWLWNVSRQERLPFPGVRHVPVAGIIGNRTVVTCPSASLVVKVAAYNDGMFAYLMFDHLRYSGARPGTEVLLNYRGTAGRPEYSLWVHFQDGDLVAAMAHLSAMRAANTISGYDWRFVPRSALRRARQQTAFLVAGYNLPFRRTLASLPPAELAAYLRRFVQFKSTTDRRVRLGIPPIPRELSTEEAARLAADIVAVASFYELPLEFFLGIGAMENNYMDVTGDLEHKVWKKRAEPGDVVLKRRRGRVLVSNHSIGVWQITRESLRYAHRIFLKDTRDYTALPQRLRPPADFDFGRVSAEVLTTYAGLLFRDLLDRFPGEIGTAVGAYNGGAARPNPRYEAGVTRIAEHARRVLEGAAALDGHPVVDIPFLAPQPHPGGA